MRRCATSLPGTWAVQTWIHMQRCRPEQQAPDNGGLLAKVLLAQGPATQGDRHRGRGPRRAGASQQGTPLPQLRTGASTCQAVAMVGTAPRLMASTYCCARTASMGPVTL